MFFVVFMEVCDERLTIFRFGNCGTPHRSNAKNCEQRSRLRRAVRTSAASIALARANDLRSVLRGAAFCRSCRGIYGGTACLIQRLSLVAVIVDSCATSAPLILRW